MQSSITQCLFQARINQKGCLRAFSINVVGTMEAEELANQMSRNPVEMSVWMPLLAELTQSHIRDIVRFQLLLGGAGVILGPSWPFTIGVWLSCRLHVAGCHPRLIDSMASWHL